VVTDDYSVARSVVRSLVTDDFVTAEYFVTTTVKTVAYDQETRRHFVTNVDLAEEMSLGIRHADGFGGTCACARPDPSSLGWGIRVCRICLETITPKGARPPAASRA
jgi:hypothetical protein